eukprot:c19279_g1_i1.p1 GENE.c19279_g1_i1~~c19279_g1_i1.p1  ORF type:complete len:360 (+),score=139.73 c19279_g1_i1:311-1390(+)
MEVPPPISEGSLTKILEGKKVPQPTLMVLSLKKSSPYGKYHKQSSMMIGDGERYSGAIISPIMQKGLKANSIVTLKQYICAKSNGHDVIFVLDMKHYQEDEPPPPPPPPTIVDINPAPNTKLTRTTSRDQSNMNEEDENIPPKLHRGTSFGQGSRDSLFSPNTTQAQRELARELAKATANARNIEYGEDDEPILIHRTHSTGFYRSTKYIESDPFAEEDHDDEEDDDDNDSEFERIKTNDLLRSIEEEKRLYNEKIWNDSTKAITTKEGGGGSDKSEKGDKADKSEKGSKSPLHCFGLSPSRHHKQRSSPKAFIIRKLRSHSSTDLGTTTNERPTSKPSRQSNFVANFKRFSLRSAKET